MGDGQWQERDGALVYEAEFPDFRAAMSFVDRVADLAEEQGHHPDILIHGWNKVRLSLSTHSAGAITEADHELARRIKAL